MTYGWVQRAAHILNDEDQRGEAAVKRRLQGLLGAMTRHQARAGSLTPAVDHFIKVSRSYWPGLFHCYSVPELPRTNRVPIMIWNSPLARSAITNGGRPGGKAPHPPWCCAVRCNWSPMPPRACGPSRGRSLHPTSRRPGGSCASVLRPVVSCARTVVASAAIQHRISRSLRRTYSSSVCHPSFLVPHAHFRGRVGPQFHGRGRSPTRDNSIGNGGSHAPGGRARRGVGGAVPTRT